MSEAPTLDGLYQEFKDQGFILLSIWENESGEEPSLDEIQDWADSNGMSMPVLRDGGLSTISNYASGSIGLPYTFLLGPGLEQIKANPTEAEIEEQLGK